MPKKKSTLNLTDQSEITTFNIASQTIELLDLLASFLDCNIKDIFAIVSELTPNIEITEMFSKEAKTLRKMKLGSKYLNKTYYLAKNVAATLNTVSKKNRCSRDVLFENILQFIAQETVRSNDTLENDFQALLMQLSGMTEKAKNQNINSPKIASNIHFKHLIQKQTAFWDDLINSMSEKRRLLNEIKERLSILNSLGSPIQ